MDDPVRIAFVGDRPGELVGNAQPMLRLKVSAAFDGGRITSDGGVMLFSTAGASRRSPAGRQPPELTAHRLIRTVDLPIAWTAQKQLLGLG
jgi:hypothetical protein